MTKNPYSLVLVTAPDRKTAEALACGLLEKKLAACVTAVNGVVSRYWWKGSIEKADETLLIVKTRAALFSRIALFVKKNHPYNIPEIIALKLDAGSREYLDWLGANSVFSADSEEDDKFKILERKPLK